VPKGREVMRTSFDRLLGRLVYLLRLSCGNWFFVGFLGSEYRELIFHGTMAGIRPAPLQRFKSETLCELTDQRKLWNWERRADG
jgi:hypothetical protein